LLLLTVGGGFAGYWWLQGQVNKWTSDTPADLPIVEYSEEEIQEIKDRVETFQETVDEGDTPEQLVLTAEEINALISEEEDFKGRVYVRLEDGKISGDVSIPTDFLPGGEGRYFNASATFNASLDNGVLIVTLVDAEVKGERVPAPFIEGMSQENLAKDVYKDPEVAQTLRRFESMRIEDDKIILIPRRQTAVDEAAAGEESASEAAATDSGTDEAATQESPPGEETPAGDAPPDKVTPENETPGDETAGDETAGDEAPETEKPETEKAETEKAATEKAATEKAENEKAENEKAADPETPAAIETPSP
jgi:hypothetical protein